VDLGLESPELRLIAIPREAPLRLLNDVSEDEDDGPLPDFAPPMDMIEADLSTP
jgi:hypothetical protein